MGNSNIALEEQEFQKLMRLTERIELVQLRGERVMQQLQAELRKAIQERDAYFLQLSTAYPELRKDVQYTPNETTHELVPQEQEAGP